MFLRESFGLINYLNTLLISQMRSVFAFVKKKTVFVLSLKDYLNILLVYIFFAQYFIMKFSILNHALRKLNTTSKCLNFFLQYTVNQRGFEFISFLQFARDKVPYVKGLFYSYASPELTSSKTQTQSYCGDCRLLEDEDNSRREMKHFEGICRRGNKRC